MRNERRILFNAGVLSVTEGFGQLANLILVVSFARAFGAGAMGHYSVAMAVGAVAALFVSLGTQSLLVREFSRNPAVSTDWLGKLLPVQLSFALIAWAVASAAAVGLVRDVQAAPVAMAVCAYQILLRIAALLLTPLQAKELMLISSIGDMAHRALILILGVLAIHLGASAGLVSLMLVIGATGFVAFAWVQTSRRFGRPRLRFAPSEALQLFRLSAPFFGLAALAVIYARGVIIMLSALAAAHAVGLYAAADRLMVAVGLGPTMFNSAVYPALARVASQSLAEAKALCGRCLRLLLVAAIPCAALAAVFAPEIVRMLFGAAYADAAGVLQVLAWTLPMRGAQSLLGSQLATLDQQTALARARLIGLCCFFIAAPLLILFFGYVGAAVSVLVCDTLQLGLYYRLLRKLDAAPPIIAAFLRLASAAGAAAAAGFLLPTIYFGWRLLGVLAVMFAAMWILGAVKSHDLRFLRALIANKP